MCICSIFLKATNSNDFFKYHIERTAKAETFLKNMFKLKIQCKLALKTILQFVLFDKRAKENF